MPRASRTIRMLASCRTACTIPTYRHIIMHADKGRRVLQTHNKRCPACLCACVSFHVVAHVLCQLIPGIPFILTRKACGAVTFGRFYFFSHQTDDAGVHYATPGTWYVSTNRLKKSPAVYLPTYGKSKGSCFNWLPRVNKSRSDISRIVCQVL